MHRSKFRLCQQYRQAGVRQLRLTEVESFSSQYRSINMKLFMLVLSFQSIHIQLTIVPRAITPILGLGAFIHCAYIRGVSSGSMDR